MTRKKVSRNAPCPCGSGKKFKHCCHGKGIDWSEPGPSMPRLPPGPVPLGQYGIVDTRLKALARASAEAAEWKPLVERLSDRTPDEQRLGTYRALRAAGVLPDEVTVFLVDWALQWMPPAKGDAVDGHTVTLLRRFGFNDLADAYVSDRLAFDRRRERGRQFFYGPPDEELARHLRAKGIIE
jgi:hypothetical protein